MPAPLRLAALASALVLGGLATASAVQAQDEPCTTIHMQRGSTTIVLTGRITQDHASYCYRFKAHAGQILRWDLNGPATRVVIGYPNGDGEGPGIPQRIELQQDGAYTFSVSANLMAEGAYGRFRLRLTIV